MRLAKVLGSALFIVAFAGSAYADKAWQEEQFVPGGKEYWPSVVGASAADVNEVEPNDTCASANAYVLGDVYHGFLTTNDNDWVSFTANAGDVITAGTDQDGADTVDTLIDLIANDCTTVIETDDDDGPGLYSLITRPATYSGTYYVRVRPFTTSTGNYKLTITAAPPPPPPANDTCAGATVIPRCTAYTESGSTVLAVNDYSPSDVISGQGCTGFWAQGKDVVYRLDLLAGDAVSVGYTSTADGSIYLITDCADEPNTCVAGADATLSGQLETFNYVVAATDTYYLVADNYATDTSGTFTLTVTISCPVSTETASWGQVKAQYR
jgi:hypothetical protein